MKVKIFNGSVYLLRSIAERWANDCNFNEIGIEFDIGEGLRDLQRLINSYECELLVLCGEKIVGFMGLEIFKSPVGKQKMCNEHYFYVLPEYRGISSLKLIKAARQWAKERGCSHLLMNASYLASDMHDKVCEIYKRTGMRRFESSFISIL